MRKPDLEKKAGSRASRAEEVAELIARGRAVMENYKLNRYLYYKEKMEKDGK